MLSIIPVTRIREIKKGDDLGKLIVDRLVNQGDELQNGDIAVISQKIVSKAEGRILPLSKVSPSTFAKTIAKETGKDRSEEHTSELQSHVNLVCRLLLEKKKKTKKHKK